MKNFSDSYASEKGETGMKLISVVAPMYNESGIVERYCQKTREVLETLADKYEYEIVLVNDGSADKTLTEMLSEQEQDPQHIAIVSLTRNFGLEGAVQAGLRYAKGDAVVVMDADLQDPPELIREMVSQWEDGADIVHGVRSSRKSDSFFKRKTANLYYTILSNLSGKVKIKPGAANYKLVSRKAIELMDQLPEHNKVFRTTVPYIGLKTGTVEYERVKRYAGKTKYNLKSMIPYALDSITGVSVEPLRKTRIPVYLFCFMMLCSLIFAVVIQNELWRFAAISLFMFSLFAVMVFVCIAVMAEYIAQIFIEVKGRPISMVERYIPPKREEV